MGTISFNKNLPAETSKAIGSLEQHFSTLLEQMVYFQLELDKHNGKAAVSLKDKIILISSVKQAVGFYTLLILCFILSEL
ncbi:hypothetical protein SAMN04487944_11932 [Gracilibacillus ureilyticus]|uniref:Uncharacterized protein n=1 Tax=Gracilibacillus ureilyticus TaxID=531814 RepID=A0A1H9UT34_9BACI|nr:hypothetical protein [Gracilibacillus ureilyticus]SES12508.1 hypothetical protein SAMN04487944_11932 [Gracilibacillus ureilyticus]